MNISFEPLTEEHRIPFMDILNDYSENSFAAYPETRMPYERFDFFLENAKSYPAYVAVDTGCHEVVGFFHLRPYNQLPTFKETCEITIFLRKDAVGQGLGEKAYRLLEEEAKKRGIMNILAGIVSLNDKSLRFHRRQGFHECGCFTGIGKKFDQVFDVVWMQKAI